MMLKETHAAICRAKNRENEAMTTLLHRESAKIYQFRPRSALSRGERSSFGRSTPDTQRPQVSVAIACDSWYHEAAVRDADAPRKS
jgi:hypothetical protein